MASPAPTILYAPPDAARDSNGYVIESDYENNSTWSGRAITNLSSGVRRAHAYQRSQGFKVYDGDPGKHPYDMNASQRIRYHEYVLGDCCKLF